MNACRRSGWCRRQESNLCGGVLYDKRYRCIQEFKREAITTVFLNLRHIELEFISQRSVTAERFKLASLIRRDRRCPPILVPPCLPFLQRTFLHHPPALPGVSKDYTRQMFGVLPEYRK